MGIPYTGSGFQSTLTAFDKVVSKEQFHKNCIPTPRSKTLKEYTPMPFGECVIKPAREGSSVGIHIVDNEADYKEKLEDTFRYDKKVLVEEKIDGMELTVGVLAGEVLPVIWIRPKSGVYDYESKYTKGKTEYIFDTGLSEAEYKKVQGTAMMAYDSLECSGYGRVDVMYDGKVPYVLEVNTLPGMTETSLFPKAAAEAGYSFDELIEKMLLEALK